MMKQLSNKYKTSMRQIRNKYETIYEYEYEVDHHHLTDGEARSYLDPACLKEPAVKEVDPT